MHEKIHEILLREATRLNEQSKTQQLSTVELAYLDKLIKLYKSFIGETSAAPEELPLEDLLEDIKNDPSPKEARRKTAKK